jgi:hypothetical protein
VLVCVLGAFKSPMVKDFRRRVKEKVSFFVLFLDAG